MLLAGLTLTLSPTVTQSEVTLGNNATVASITGQLLPSTTYTVTVAGKEQAGNAPPACQLRVHDRGAVRHDGTDRRGTVPANAATGWRGSRRSRSPSPSG